MDILTLLVDSCVAFTGTEARRLLSADKVFLLPSFWEKGDPIPENVLCIRDPHYTFTPRQIVSCNGYVFQFESDSAYKLIELPRRKNG